MWSCMDPYGVVPSREKRKQEAGNKEQVLAINHQL